MSNFTKINYLKGKSKINNFSFERNQYISGVWYYINTFDILKQLSQNDKKR